MSERTTAESDPAMGQLGQYLPPEYSIYFEAILHKHFGENGVGSVFTEVKTLSELLELALEQRGSLGVDDRTTLESMGVDPKSLLPGCRYILVETQGKLGIVRATDLPPETLVYVERVKPGVPCSLVVELPERPDVPLGTIIIGPNKQENTPGGVPPSTAELVWTVHPGLPIRPSAGDSWPEGSTITVAKVIEILGEGAYLNIRVPQEPAL